MKNLPVKIAMLLVLGSAVCRAEVTLMVEEPYGTFGGMNPTGHAAIYLSRVCAATPLTLRRCEPGEAGAVISRYHRVGGYDWIAIPLIAYLYAVDSPDQVPDWATPSVVASLRDQYRRAHLEMVAPDASGGTTPPGDWTQLVGESYDRAIYTFGMSTTPQQDDKLIRIFNSRPNHVRFHLLFKNCADFARQVIALYYPKAIHRNFSDDLGIMTPKQLARCVVRYDKKHPRLNLSTYVIPQVSGTVPRSSEVRGVLESLLKSKRYAFPLASLAVFHPAVGGGLAYAWLAGSQFDPRHVTLADGERNDRVLTPDTVANSLALNDETSVAAWSPKPVTVPQGR